MATHLSRHRPLILLRSLVSTAAAFVPVPFVDDFLSGAARRALVRRLAELRQVDIDEPAVQVLARLAPSPTQKRLRFISLLTRRFARPLTVFARADEFIELLCVATLFDHYCALHHVGFGVDEARAIELRRVMQEASSAAPVRALESGLRRLMALPDVRRRWRRTMARIAARLGKGPVEPEIVVAETRDDTELRGYNRCVDPRL